MNQWRVRAGFVGCSRPGSFLGFRYIFVVVDLDDRASFQEIFLAFEKRLRFDATTVEHSLSADILILNFVVVVKTDQLFRVANFETREPSL